MFLKNITYLNRSFHFEKGSLGIDGGKINIAAVEENYETVMDCSDYLVIPGLVNAHFHSYSSLAKGLMREMPIQEWCNDSEQGELQNHLFNYLDTKATKEEFVLIGQHSYIEMVKNGVTFVSDGDPGDYPELLADGINELGIRGIVDTHGKIANYAGKVNRNVSYGTHLLEEEDITEESLAALEKLKEEYPSEIKLTHCMENGWRKEIVYSNFGKSSVELYFERGLLDDKTVLYHGVHMSEKDIRLVAENRCSVVHCPISNLWSGAGQANVKEMLRKKVNVCLGTDYAHTDMWEVMRMAYYLLKLNTEVTEFSAEDIFQMATLNGAKAYGLDGEIGSIQDGNKADLVFIKKDPSLYPLVKKGNFSNYLHNLLTNTQKESIKHVMVEGKWIMYDRKVLTIDEKKIKEHYEKMIGKIFYDVAEEI